MKSYIHLIRHGLTQGIMEDWFYGSMDIPITPEGFGILQEFKEQGVYPEAKEADFYTTGMLRTNQTLNVIYDNPEHSIIRDLRELNFGDWEGMYFKDMDSMTDWVAWSHDLSGTYTFPNGDSAKSFSDRVYRGWDQLMELHKEKEKKMFAKGKDAESVLVCHGGTISVLMATFFPDERPGDFFAWSPETGRGYTLEVVDGKIVGYTFI